MPRKTIDITPINQKNTLVSGEIGVINSPLIAADADDAGHPVSGKPKMVSPLGLAIAMVLGIGFTAEKPLPLQKTGVTCSRVFLCPNKDD